MHTDLTCHSPFQFQVHRNRTQVVRVLLENGADSTAQTDKGKTATDMADGKPEILTLLGVDAETAASSVAEEVDASGVGRVRESSCLDANSLSLLFPTGIVCKRRKG